ncbi:redoxin family protein [Microbacterium sp. YY-01]|uniref:TlpA family protein disulfide reductase n=1 Tax=Microbacterium sp. YY-01 TaxID=3421634 RepID=UPI003D17B47C
MTPRPWLRGGAALALTACIFLTGCSTAQLGGADALPGPVPDGVNFVTAEDTVPAPAVSGSLTDGTTVAWQDLWTERPLVVEFTATWCTQCADREQGLRDVADANDDAVTMLRVFADDEAATITDYLKKNKVSGPAMVDRDGSLWGRYAVTEAPVTALIDTSGGIVRMWPGGASTDALQSSIDALIEH